ncbi:MAG TPA: Ig-like domain-containing protein, partial [Pirellulales bacterium]|nr:Ig-like domain-containing protein [Pirellulales bacterium]
MKLRSMEPKSPARKLLDIFKDLGHRVCKVFIAPVGIHARRGRPRACLHSAAIVGVQQLEPRLNLTPVAVADSYYGNAGGTTTIPAAEGVLANDSGSNLSAVLVSQPYFGSVALNSDGSFTYENSSYSSGDEFSYKDFDGTNYSNTVDVSLSLSSNGAAPHAQNDPNPSVVHDQTLTVAAPGVLAGAGDPNNIPLTAVLATQPAHGTATLSADGQLVYTPDYHYTGSDSLTFEAYNGYEYSSPATVTVTVTDQAPIANNDGYQLPNSQTLNVDAATGVLANDAAPDGGTLTASLVSQPAHGSLTFNSDGSFSYTPDSGWVGTDSFTYDNSDGIMTSSTATVTLVTQYSVLSAVDQTKVPVDTIHVSQQILNDNWADQSITSPLPAGGSGGT